MAKDTDNLTLGGGSLYLNGVEVGWLSGEVHLRYERVGMRFSAAGSGSTQLRPMVKASLRAAVAEFSVQNLRLALGMGKTVNASTGSMSYDPTSYSFETSSTSWEGVKLGGESMADAEVPLRFEHTKVDGKKIVVVFYQAASVCDLLVPFGDEKVTMFDVEFVAVPEQTRPAGDRVGIVFEET